MAARVIICCVCASLCFFGLYWISERKKSERGREGKIHARMVEHYLKMQTGWAKVLELTDGQNDILGKKEISDIIKKINKPELFVCGDSNISYCVNPDLEKWVHPSSYPNEVAMWYPCPFLFKGETQYVGILFGGGLSEEHKIPSWVPVIKGAIQKPKVPPEQSKEE